MELHFAASEKSYPQAYYNAFDGRQFRNSKECLRYEYKKRKELIPHIEFCEAMNNIKPFNPDCEYEPSAEFYWYKPKNQREVKELGMIYNIDIDIEPNNWVCIEYAYSLCRYHKLSDSLAYAKYCLTQLGFIK